MREKYEEKFEKIKDYCGTGFICLLIFDIILGAAMYDEGILFKEGELVNIVLVFCLPITAVLFIVLIVLGIILKKWQGDMYVSIGDIFETVGILFFPFDGKSKKEIYQILGLIGNKEEIVSSSLWKKTTKGINIWNLLPALFFYWFAGGIAYVVIDEWIEMGEQRVLMTVLGVIFFVGSFFWGGCFASDVKRRPDSLLDYVIAHEIDYWSLNQDFSMAEKYGSKLYIGAKYVFVMNREGMHVVARDDITECEVIRKTQWGGGDYSAFSVAYYMLSISTEDDYILKCGISPRKFYRFQDAILNHRE